MKFRGMALGLVLLSAFFLMTGFLGAQSPVYSPDYLSTYYHDLLDFMRT